MTYQRLTTNQTDVLYQVTNGPKDGLPLEQIAQNLGMSPGRARRSAHALRDRGLITEFTYRGGQRVWRLAPKK